MTNRAELRDALRLRLEDGAPAPLWEDAALNEALAEAMRAYGLRVPGQRVTPLVVAGGETELAVPAVSGDGCRVVRVIDPRGRVVPPAAGDPAEGQAAQSWRWWAGSLVLSRPALAGTWRLEHLTGRLVPANDAEEADIVAGDEELVVVLAMASALRRRAIADGKRGSRSQALALASAARAEAAALFASRRRARGGWLERV